MSKSRASYSGSCQSCGAGQKLPDGRLSLHGYSVQWGFFNGICPGSRGLPYEQSYDLIQRYVDSAKRQLTATEAFRTSLLFPATEPKGWKNEYVPATVQDRRRGRYEWRLVEIVRVGGPPSLGPDFWTPHYADKEGKLRRLDIRRWWRASTLPL